MSDPESTVVFAGGGTGGHLVPGLATADRLRERDPGLGAHFICSDRPLDARLLGEADEAYTPVPMRPLPTRPWRVPAFLRGWRRSTAAMRELMDRTPVAAVVAMGGFVAVPVVEAARRRGVPTAVVNLDAVPGKANRWLARRCDRVFGVPPTDRLPRERTEPIAMPLRRNALAGGDPAAARRAFGLDPDPPVLLVTGASQGAESINDAMMALARQPAFIEVMRHWQVLHLAGAGRAEPVERAYRDAGIRATVLAFCDQMGLAWDAAELAVSRAGAGSVAEAAANTVPGVFLPYPHHRDQHQRRNAEPLAEAGGATIVDDAVDPWANADRLVDPLVKLLNRPERRREMADALRGLDRGDGAEQLAGAILHLARRFAQPTDVSAEPPPASPASGETEPGKEGSLPSR
jgi:UDP-N-acetylglucosamine--N-acetylmuramyl-(pentapeptide) pyrophosphoryl-undecaprenol N-acetylglucosamine transferase